jgi:hypothetical protein
MRSDRFEGPRTWAQSGPNAGDYAHRERLLDRRRLLHPRSLETQRQIPPIWGSRGCEFKSLQPDNKIRRGRQDCHGSAARPISGYCGPLGEGAQF